VRAASQFSQFPNRPRHRCRLSRRDLSGTARCASRKVAQKSGLGAAERCLKRGLEMSRTRANRAVPAAPIRQIGRDFRPRTMRRWHKFRRGWSTRDSRACAATVNDAARSPARSAFRHRARFMRCDPKSAGLACPATPNAPWHAGDMACRGCEDGSGDRRFGRLVVEGIVERPEHAERLGRQRDRLATE